MEMEGEMEWGRTEQRRLQREVGGNPILLFHVPTMGLSISHAAPLHVPRSSLAGIERNFKPITREAFTQVTSLL